MTGEPRIPRDPSALPVHAEADAKAALRRHLLGVRRTLEAPARAAWDAAIGAQVLAWWHAQAAGGARALGVYRPLRGEPDLSAAYAELARRGVGLALPVVLARDAALGFAAWQPGEPMAFDQMGVAVPQQLRMLPCPPVLLVPCLGFNADKYRLGYGGGYYDRTLAAAPRPRTLGIAYACMQAQFASAPHDVALDQVLTEAFTL